MLEAHGTAAANSGVSLADLIRRPQISYEDLKAFDPERPQLSKAIVAHVVFRLQFDGYIMCQL